MRPNDFFAVTDLLFAFAALIPWWRIQPLEVAHMRKLVRRLDGTIRDPLELELVRRTIESNMKKAVMLMGYLILGLPSLVAVLASAGLLSVPGALLTVSLPMVGYLIFLPPTLEVERALKRLASPDDRIRVQYERWRQRWTGPHIHATYDADLGLPPPPSGALSLDDLAERRGSLSKPSID